MTDRKIEACNHFYGDDHRCIKCAVPSPKRIEHIRTMHDTFNKKRGTILNQHVVDLLKKVDEQGAELDRLKAERVERDVALLQFDHEYRRERSKNGPFTYDPKNVIAAFNRRNTTKDNGND